MSSTNGHSETPPGWGPAVYRATQIVAAQHGVDNGAALLCLADWAAAETRTLHDIADDVIAGRPVDPPKAVKASPVNDPDLLPDDSGPLLEEDGSVHHPQPFPPH